MMAVTKMRPWLLASIVTVALTAAAAGAAEAPVTQGNDGGRSALRDCLETLPFKQLSDENAIAACLEKAQRAAVSERGRESELEADAESQRRTDEFDRLIERTTRGSRKQY